MWPIMCVPIIPSCVSNYSSSSLVFHKSIFLYQMCVRFQTISSFNMHPSPPPSNSIFINWISKIRNNFCRNSIKILVVHEWLKIKVRPKMIYPHFWLKMFKFLINLQTWYWLEGATIFKGFVDISKVFQSKICYDSCIGLT